MTLLDSFKRFIRNLAPHDYSSFREWFLGYEADLWDRRIEKDALSGRLDGLAEEAVKAYNSGNTRPL